MKRRAPLVPGERCPAARTGKASDPAVKVTDSGRSWRKGRRDCGRCGAKGVGVVQSWGAKQSAWYYNPHEVPAR